MRDLSADGVPAVWVTAGDLFFEEATAAHAPDAASMDSASLDEAKTEQLWRAETLADVLKQLGLAAAVPGPADARYGAETLASLDARAGKPLLSGAGSGAARVVERSGARVGVWALRESSDTPAATLLQLATKHTAELRAQRAEIVIGLLHADPRAARRIAGAVTGLDFLLVGGERKAAVAPPERIGSTTLLRAGRDGHGLLIVDLFRAGEGAFEDVSAWTQAESRRALASQVSELEAKIVAWRKDPSTDRALLAEQEQRLQRLRSEQKSSGASGGPLVGQPRSNAFSARYVELDPDVPGDPELRALLAAHDKRVNDHNRVALAHLVAPKVAEGMPSYVGAERCGSCHDSEHQWWRGHEHGRAYETLVTRNKQFSLSCVGCHVTGYGKAGGSTVTHNAGLVDVGCESCHGPGSLHADDPDVDTEQNVVRDTPESVCVECHNEEHSDLFEYAKYKAKLIVPGHGLPVARITAPAPAPAPVPGATE
jgi:hypothetical protein